MNMRNAWLLHAWMAIPGFAVASECPSCAYDHEYRALTLAHDDASKDIYVDDYAASAGDYFFDDRAIQVAMHVAKDGERVLLSPGETYTVCRPVYVYKAIVLATAPGGEKATIRRCDAQEALLTAPAFVGDKMVQVDDSSPFVRGMQVSPVRYFGGGPAAGEVDVTHVVLGASDGLVEFSKPLHRNYAVGDSLITSFNMLEVTSPGASVVDVVMDGNRSGNGHFAAWQTHKSISVGWGADGVRIDGVEFVESQADAINITGASGVSIERSLFEGLNGSAVHVSNTANTTVRGSAMRRTNEDAYRIGHAEGVVTWSHNNEAVSVEKNCAQGAPEAAFVRWNVSTDNHGARITDNRVCGTQGFLDVFASDTSASATSGDMSHNIALDVGECRVDGVTGLVFVGNTLYGGSLVAPPGNTFVGNWGFGQQE